MNFATTLFQFALIVFFAPFAAGLVKFFKARLQGRRGASPLLPYATIATLFRKQLVISKSTSWVFRLAPFVVLASALFLTFILPIVEYDGWLAPYSHFLIVAGMLMMGTIFLVFGGLDSASAFGGMGSSREMTIASLVEPTFILVFGALALESGRFEVRDMVFNIHIVNQPFILLSLLAFALVALAENARYPVDNPATHLELTMVHEAMVLEYSGPLLALMEYASFIKLTLFATLLSNFFLPVGLLTSSSGTGDFAAAPVFFAGKIIVMMFFLALLETSIVKMRFYRVNEFLAAAFFLALGGMALALVTTLL